MTNLDDDFELVFYSANLSGVTNFTINFPFVRPRKSCRLKYFSSTSVGTFGLSCPQFGGFFFTLTNTSTALDILLPPKNFPNNNYTFSFIDLGSTANYTGVITLIMEFR